MLVNYLPVRIEKIESLVGHFFGSLHDVDIVHNNFWCYWPTLQNTLHGSFSKFRFLTSLGDTNQFHSINQSEMLIEKVETKLHLNLSVACLHYIQYSLNRKLFAYDLLS